MLIRLLLLAVVLSAPVGALEYRVGAARVDITPDFPVRLAGYASRSEESEGVEAPIFLKAVAIAAGRGRPAVLVAVDNCAVPAYLVEEVAGRLRGRVGLRRERFVVCSTHTHGGPMLRGTLPTLFGKPIPPEHQARIDGYTRRLADWMEEGVLAAIAAMRPAMLDFGVGTAGFAANRRTPGGPVDHDLPVLVARGADGAPVAVVCSYACHCTTLGALNKVSGDWAGYAQAGIEAASPGAVSLVLIGCGADANPAPRGSVALAEAHGGAIVAGVSPVVGGAGKAVSGRLKTEMRWIDFPYEALPSREEWAARAAQGGAVGYHAQVQLEKLERGERLPTSLRYPLARWSFGDDLAIMFLAGEVVVDYSLAFKRRYDPARVWISAYANDVPCYIPSARVWTEGGYEGGDSMIYFDRPGRFAEGVEERINAAIAELMPAAFRMRD